MKHWGIFTELGWRGLKLLSIMIIVSSSVNGKMVDLTHLLNAKASHFPLFRDFELKTALNGNQPSLGGLWVEANELLLNEHTGTHVDAPAHTWETGIHMHEIPLSDLMGPAVVIDIKEKVRNDIDYILTVQDIEDFEKKHGRIPDRGIVFIDTDGAKDYWNPTAYLGTKNPLDLHTLHFPGFSGDSINWLIDNRDIKGIGSDRMSLDAGQARNHSAHIALLSQNRFGIENLNNVDKIPPVGSTVFVMTLPIEHGSGSPARIVGFWDTDLPGYGTAGITQMSLIVTIVSLLFSVCVGQLYNF